MTHARTAARRGPGRPALGQAAAAVLLLAGCREEPASRVPPPPDPSEPPPASRVVVLSADRLVIDGEIYRLAGAAAPLPIPEARCWAEAAAAKAGIQLAKRLLVDAQTMTVHKTGREDSSGRPEVEVALDRLDLAQTLYENGVVARPRTRDVFRWCEQISQETDGGPRWSSLFEPGD